VVPAAELRIVRETARIALAIVAAIELNRVEENAYHDTGAFPAGGFEQPSVPGMRDPIVGTNPMPSPALRMGLRNALHISNGVKEPNGHLPEPLPTGSPARPSMTGNLLHRTSSAHSRAASTICSPRFTYCFTNEENEEFVIHTGSRPR